MTNIMLAFPYHLITVSSPDDQPCHLFPHHAVEKITEKGLNISVQLLSFQVSMADFSPTQP